MITATEIQEGVGLASQPPPETAPSRSIRVPTLLVVGGSDNLSCGPPDGLDCDTSGVLGQEGPYYSPQARLEAVVIPATGHSLQLNYTGGLSSALIQLWITRHVPA